MFKMFSSCHPTQYLRSNPGGRYLLDHLNQISMYHIRNYLQYIIREQDDDYRLPSLQKYWIRQLKINLEQNKMFQVLLKILKSMKRKENKSSWLKINS